MKVGVLTSVVAGLAILSGPVLAHHSFAMFDPEKRMTQTGTVKELEWTNPHVWIHITAPDPPASNANGPLRCRPCSRP